MNNEMFKMDAILQFISIFVNFNVVLHEHIVVLYRPTKFHVTILIFVA